MININEKIFIKLLSKAIGSNQKIDYTNSNFAEIINISKEQNLESIIFSIIKEERNSQNELKISKEQYNKITSEAIRNNIRQIKFISKLEEILRNLNKENITPILLKGLVLRSYYKNPLYRTMGDGYILVKKEELDKVVEIIKKHGFEEVSRAGVHVHLKDKEEFRIEIHWDLINAQYFKGEEEFNKYVWNNLEQYNFNGANCLKFNNTNFLTHLILHMAKHKKGKNINIRGLLDIALFVEKEKSTIDWNKFKKNTEELGLEKFTEIMMILLKIQFGINPPEEMQINLSQIKDEENIENINRLMRDTFDNGVHGKKGGDKALVSGQTKGIFITQNEFSYKYGYVKKYKMLLPIAWVHRIIKGTLHKDFTLSQKITYLFKRRGVQKEILELNEWLGI